MYTLISFATYWGSKYGGINAFNADFLGRFGNDYKDKVQVICLVASAEEQDFAKAMEEHVLLVKLPYVPQDKIFAKDQAQAACDELNKKGITFKPNTTIWLGHDRISGEAAIEAARVAGGRSALIHHMSYEAYEGFAEDSQAAYAKVQIQKQLFEAADLLLAVGPLLHEALADLLDKPKEHIHCLVPGLAEIEPRKNPSSKFRAFLSGRLSDDAKKIKQGHLGIAGFAHSIRFAYEQNSPKALLDQPIMTLRGVDFESRQNYVPDAKNSIENEWQNFAEKYAKKRINLSLLPYIQDRQRLYDDLKQSSVALMPSWHEGFGLVAWEAIAAGVPLIVGKNSGVYRLLEKEFQDGLVMSIDVEGKTQAPFFSDSDINSVAKAIKSIAEDLESARKRALELRSRLDKYTWTACVEHAAEFFGWRFPSNPSAQPASTTITSPAISTPVVDISSAAPDSPLVMPGKYWQRGLPESRLLWADEAVVPFEGGQSEFLINLQAWLDDPTWPLAMRLVTGAGGTGKTRLSVELCRQQIQAGWCCGFWSNHETITASVLWQSLSARNQPLLIVIDYAETRQSAVLALVKTILQHPGANTVRLFLLARTGGEWWDSLPGKDRDCECFLSSYATSGPYALPLLYLETNRRFAAYQRAVAAYAQALGVPIPTAICPDLSGDHFAKPLYLQMAALLALLGEHPATADGLTKALLNHERRYWAKALADVPLPEPENLAQYLLGLATLAGGFPTAKAAWPYWQNACSIPLSATQFSQLFNALAPLYPGKQGLQAVQPDLLGEALVAQIVAQSSGQALLEVVLRESRLQYAGSTVIARLHSHHPGLDQALLAALTKHFVPCCKTIAKVAMETPGSLTELACEAFSQLSDSDKSQAAGLLNPLLQDESVELARLDYLVSEFEAEKTKKKLAKPGMAVKDALRIAHAKSLNNLSVAMCRVGGLEAAACEQAEEAVSIYRSLAKSNHSIDFEQVYANCLNTFAACLSDLGKSNEALPIEKQALAIRERLAVKHPDRFEPDYARSLSNYAEFLRAIGDTDTALATAKQALAIRERLAAKHPDCFEPEYATSLSNYASLLSEVGNTADALATAKQALAIMERLAAKHPDRFEPEYARSLSNYANLLSEVGNTADALATAKQALAIIERLAAKHPDRFEPVYANSLSNYASFLSDISDTDTALATAKQALAIRERLAAKHPDRFEPDYATSLSNYANRLSEVGNTTGALATAKQALAISERLAAKHPDRFEPDYARSLSNYANRLSEVGNTTDALATAKQALAIMERLAGKIPNRYESERFINLCSVLFLSWLADEVDVMYAVPSEAPSLISVYQKPELNFYLAVVQGYLAMHNEQRSAAFSMAYSFWRSLSSAQKNTDNGHSFCVWGWLRECQPEVLLDDEFAARWQIFKQKRKGNLPLWMQTVADRLRFTWPD